MPQVKRETETSADQRPTLGYLKKSPAISLMYEFAFLF